MRLSRDKIQRMFDGIGGSGSTGSGGGDMAGYATQAWVNTNFVSIEFFGRLFKAYGPGENQGDPDVEVLPNDMDSTISNIEAMFGFWTDFYLTALGNGGEIGASIYLAGLADVNVAGVQTGQVLTWNAATNKWIATTPQSGVDMSQVWAALAAQTNQQINASHLATALAGYATQTWVGQQGFLTATALTGYATELWVNTNFLGIHATADAATKLATARTLWGQSFDGTGNVSGNMSSVGYMDFSHGETTFSYSNGSYTDPSPGDDYNFKFGGSLAATYLRARYGVQSDGYVTALSDEREKNIIENFEVSLRYIAHAPVVSYTWKDKRRGDKQHIGSIAQYWLREMPELVPEVNGRYTMDYGRIALLSAILTARHVVNLEQRIDRLEKMIHDGE